MQCGFEELDAYRSDVASLARFSQRVDHATWYLCVAIDPPDKVASADRVERKRPRATATQKGWYGRLANQCFSRWRDTRDVLAATSSVPDASERFYRTAFWSLCELTPADSQLKRLFEEDRPRACRELVRHVDAYADQLALATDLAASLDADDSKDADPGDEATLASLQRALLDKAGDPLTLTQAAERLRISRQALHKKIKTRAALGLMFGETLVVPSVQLVDGESGFAIVAHLRKVLTLFSESGAGDWSALQYLIEPDPALGGKRPIDLLKAGDTPIVVAAARAFLGLDEG